MIAFYTYSDQFERSKLVSLFLVLSYLNRRRLGANAFTHLAMRTNYVGSMRWVFSLICRILSFTPRKHHHHSPREQRTRKLCVREQYFRKKLSGSCLTFSLELCGFLLIAHNDQDTLVWLCSQRAAALRVHCENLDDQQLRNIRRERERDRRLAEQARRFSQIKRNEPGHNPLSQRMRWIFYFITTSQYRRRHSASNTKAAAWYWALMLNHERKWRRHSWWCVFLWFAALIVHPEAKINTRKIIQNL
jgi:hypothetical protein